MILDSPEKSAPFYQERIKRVSAKISQAPFDALLVTELVNVRYLSGFSGTSGSILVTGENVWFFTDSRYITQIGRQAPWLEAFEYKDINEFLAQFLTERGIKRLGFESSDVTVSRASDLADKLEGVELEPVKKLIQEVRLYKDEAEIEAIRALIDILARVLPDARELIRPGAVEKDVALDLEYKMRKLGAEGPAFDFIVASGERSAMPHGVASEKVIGKNEIVVLDWGARGWGLHSDNTRTFATGRVDPELKEVFELVLEANIAALEFVKPGVKLTDVDKLGRDMITEAGYGEQFGHGTGHGVGLEIHEDPVVSWKSEMTAEKGMVFTIEPGVYIPGKGGVRIEDMALVTEDGCVNLSAGLPKEFRVLD